MQRRSAGLPIAIATPVRATQRFHQQLGDIDQAIADLHQAAACFCNQGHMRAYRQTLALLKRLQFPPSLVG
ncbi:MAG TPA: hypothetical protein V6D20_15160 [Candidatus Obscuribacterales bacterium]